MTVRAPRYILQAPWWTLYGRPDLPAAIRAVAWRLLNMRGTASGDGSPPPAAKLAGSLPVGQANYEVPTSNVRFVSPSGTDSGSGDTVGSPWATLQYAVDHCTAGDTIVMRAGRYHEAVTVNTACGIQNYPNEAAWLDGTSVVTGWVQSGSVWVKSGWTTEFDHSGSFTVGGNDGGVGPANPLAAWPDGVWVDGVALWQVSGNPGVGQFSVDYTANTLTIGTNPTGKTVVASDLQKALQINKPITLRGVGVRRYATSQPLGGTVYVSTAGDGSLLENIFLQECATQGFSINGTGTGGGTTLRNCTAYRCGHLGIHVFKTTDTVIESCLVAENNQQLFRDHPNAAGIKTGRTRRLVINNCVVRDTQGAVQGIWLDTDDMDYQITNTLVKNNGLYGLFVEATQNGIIAGNTVIGINRYALSLVDTGGTRVFNNWVDDGQTWYIGVEQDERRNTLAATKDECPWICLDNTVSNNVMANQDGVRPVLYQLYAMAKAGPVIPGDQMITRIGGNVFAADPGVTPLSGNRMTGLGAGIDNTTVTIYKTPGALKAAKPAITGSNTLTASLSPSAQELQGLASIADPIPADIAALLGVPAGSQLIGPIYQPSEIPPA